MSVRAIPDRFTQSAITVMKLAHQEARARNHRYIGPEHLLLALVHDEESRGAPLLHVLDLNAEQVRQAVERILEQHRTSPRQLLRTWLNRLKGHDGVKGLDALKLTPRARKSIALALEEAHRRACHMIGVEYLLFGLVCEGEGVAARALRSLGISVEQVREHL